MTFQYSLPTMTPHELEQYGFARARDAAFDAVQTLWRRRQAEGMKQNDLVVALDWDPALVSRKLQGPGNWTLRTLGAFVEALHGELILRVVAAEDPLPIRTNFHAYLGYEPKTLAPKAVIKNKNERVLTTVTAA